MIITRTPFRISFAGGGSDLPSYYSRRPGAVLSTAIDKYVYLAVKAHFGNTFRVSYSRTELVNKVDEIEHPLVRECMKYVGLTRGLEIVSMADLPSQSGMGSSSSFTVGLLHALYALQGKVVTPDRLAREACTIEIDKLNEPIGKQDQYIAAYGGLTCFTFHKDDRVTAAPLRLSMETMFDLEDNLLLFFTGFSRSASTILGDQHQRSQAGDDAMLSNLHYVKELGLRSQAALESGNVVRFGELMHEHWLHKKRRSSRMSNEQIDTWYELARKNGALGGKLVGAGGGGFLMFYASDRNRLRSAMVHAGLEEVRFRFDFEGTKVVLS
jgi:D-glycero-alpha-D-manno-heptose-7-phosphate kinase